MNDMYISFNHDGTYTLVEATSSIIVHSARRIVHRCDDDTFLDQRYVEMNVHSSYVEVFVDGQDSWDLRCSSAQFVR